MRATQSWILTFVCRGLLLVVAIGLLVAPVSGATRASDPGKTKSAFWPLGGVDLDDPDLLARSPDGRWLAIQDRVLNDLVRYDPAIDIVEAATGARVARIQSGVTPARRRIFTKLRTYGFLISNINEACGPGCIAGRFDAAIFSPDSKRLVTAFERRLRIWSMPDGERIGSARSNLDLVTAMAFSRDGKRLAAAADGRIVLVDGTDGRTIRELESGMRNVSKLTFSPDGRSLRVERTGGEDLWDVDRGELLRSRGTDPEAR